MKTLVQYIYESNELRPVLCIRLEVDDKAYALFYIDEHNAVKNVILNNKTVTNTTEINKIAKAIEQCGFNGYKAVCKLDRINDLVELTSVDIDNIGVDDLKQWFKKNGNAQPWIADAHS